MEGELTILLWDCLYSCINFSKIVDPSKWNKLDDLFSSLNKKILFQSNAQIKLKLLFYHLKFTAIVHAKSDLIAQSINHNFIEEQIGKGICPINYDELRPICKSQSNFFTYRWVKEFLSMYITAGNEILFMDKNIVLLFLHVSSYNI